MSQPAPVVTAAAPKPRPRPRPQAATTRKPEPAAKPAVVLPVRVPRDSAPMPRGQATPATELLEPRWLALGGIALAVVALGGAVVLGAGHRALRGAHA